MDKKELIKIIREGDVIRYTKVINKTIASTVGVVRWKLKQIYRGNSNIKEAFQMDNGDRVTKDEVLELLETNKEYKVYVVCSSYKDYFVKEFCGVLRFDKNNPRLFCKNIAKSPCIGLSGLGTTVFLHKDKANNQMQRMNALRRQYGVKACEKFSNVFRKTNPLLKSSPYEIINLLEEE